MIIEMMVMLMAFALVAEFIDSTLGMGYGTTLTPLLLLLGFEPLQVVPAILLSEMVTGITAGLTHHSFGNVSLLPKTFNPMKIFKGIRGLGVKRAFVKGTPLHLRISLTIALCSALGIVSAVFIAVNIPPNYLKIYIGCLIAVVGGVILLTRNKVYPFSWKRITILSIIASFNKGISGGGYGPVVTGGQLLSGVESKNAIGITSFAEGLTCVIGVLMYVLVANVDWSIMPYLLVGSLLSVPLSALAVNRIKTKRLTTAIGGLTFFLGCLTLIKIF